MLTDGWQLQVGNVPEQRFVEDLLPVRIELILESIAAEPFDPLAAHASDRGIVLMGVAAERLSMGRVWQDHDLVCPNQVGGPVEPRNFNRHFNTVRDHLDLPGVRLHHLRHSMVTLFSELGVAPTSSRPSPATPGWITMQTYAHANLAAMRDAMRQLGEQFL